MTMSKQLMHSQSIWTLAHSQYVIKSQKIITPSTVPRLMRSVRILPLVRYIKFHSETIVATSFRFEFFNYDVLCVFWMRKHAHRSIRALFFFLYIDVGENKDCLFSRWKEEKNNQIMSSIATMWNIWLPQFKACLISTQTSSSLNWH